MSIYIPPHSYITYARKWQACVNHLHVLLCDCFPNDQQKQNKILIFCKETLSYQYLLIYKMFINDYKQTFLALKAPTGMVYNGIQAAYIGLGKMGYFCI